MMVLPLLVLLAGGPSVELTAERLIHDDARKITTAEGNADLVAKDAAMHADRITYDEKAQGATATGHVTLRLTRRGLLAVVADVVSVRLDGDDVSEVFIYDGVALRKRNVTPAQLLAAKTQDAVRSVGSTTMSMTAGHLKRDDKGDWVVEQLSITPCECDFDKPSWHIGTSKTTVDMQADRASMLFPTIYVHDVPVFWFPWLSMPLSDRQSGLLVPVPTVTALSGFGVQVPVYLTLGRSADLTLTPSYYAGNWASTYGIAGPRLLTEFRYAPSVGTSGRATLGLIYDVRPQRSPTDPTVTPDGTPITAAAKLPRRGLRADGLWQHTQSLGHGWYDRVNGAFLSDGYYNRDFVADVLAREAGYLRSTATLFHRGDDHFVGADAIVRQDLSTGYSIFDRRGTVNPFDRLPGLTLAVPTKTLVGPLAFSLRAEGVRLAPTYAQTDGPYDPQTGFRVFQPGFREARDRLDVMPRLELAGALGGVLGASAFAAWRQDVWVGELSHDGYQRGYGLFGARLDTELGRTFGSGVRHTIAPSLEVRAVPGVIGAAPPQPYDEIDLAVPDALPHVQALAMVRQRLMTKEGGASREWLRLDVGQGAELYNPRLGESFARVSTSFWLARAAATVRVDPMLARLTRISALAAVDDNKGTGAYISYENLLDDGTDRARQPMDLLIGAPPLMPTQGRPQIITCGVHWKKGSFGARYDAIFLQGLTAATLQQQSLLLQLQAQRLGLPPVTPNYDPRVSPAQQTVGISYSPACNCWRLEVFAVYRGSGMPDVGASLTISGFGTLGTGG
jgi:LPS-assembly protein